MIIKINDNSEMELFFKEPSFSESGEENPPELGYVVFRILDYGCNQFLETAVSNNTIQLKSMLDNIAKYMGNQ